MKVFFEVLMELGLFFMISTSNHSLFLYTPHLFRLNDIEKMSLIFSYADVMTLIKTARNRFLCIVEHLLSERSLARSA